MRLQSIIVLAIAAAALAVRVYPVMPAVLGGDEVNFLETDAWYHVRLVENQVRNYPWRVTLDPYAAAGGQFVPIAPLYDTLTSTVVIVLHGKEASAADIERVAAWVPPVLGMLAVIAAWALGAQLFGPRAGALGAALLAILPGHFLDRTMLGFVDHHALEALLALLTLVALTRGCLPAAPESARSGAQPMVAGAVLGLYLLTWGSGAFLIAILGLWLLVVAALARSDEEVARVARLLAGASLVALALVLAFQDSRMYRYGTQVLGLAGLSAMSFLAPVARRRGKSPAMAATTLGVIAAAAGASVMVLWLWNPALLRQVTNDLLRVAPDASRMSVLEARPLFLYSGEWSWAEPWRNFGTGFHFGLVALVMFAGVVWRDRRSADALLWTFVASTFVATIGQNRFGYYLVPACAILGGWLADRVLLWGGWFRDRSPEAKQLDVPLQREVALVAVVAAMFAPNIPSSQLLESRNAGVPQYWRDTMFWLRQHTPAPFASAGGEDYYYARYPRDTVRQPDYTVMNWWDQGYMLMQRARRVPVANPTQERAPTAARFYVETDEARAVALLQQERSLFVIADWELPFRLTPEGKVMGRFQTVLNWSGGNHADYYEVCYRRTADGWTPVWIFHEPYYRSMAFRLVVAGGAAVTPGSASVITTADRSDAHGVHFREVVSEHTYPTYEEAEAAVAAAIIGKPIIVGLNPWQTPFPLEGLESLQRVQDVVLAGQKPTDTPWVRIFRLSAPAAPR